MSAKTKFEYLVMRREVCTECRTTAREVRHGHGREDCPACLGKGYREEVPVRLEDALEALGVTGRMP